MYEDEDETVEDISHRTWNVMRNKLMKEGYREGAALGKESVTQLNFDSGFSEGLKLAYAEGIVHGVLTVLENEKRIEESNVLEVKNNLSVNSNCIVCHSDDEIKRGSVNNVLKYVQDRTNTEINSLKDKYGNILRSINLDPDVILTKK